MSGTVEHEFLIRRKIFSILGAKFHIYNPEGELVGFSHQKAFRLKEDIRIFTDTSRSKELLAIKARNIIDFSAAYDVFDSASGEKIGALRRKGMASLFRDSWQVLDEEDGPVGSLSEDNATKAFIRRFLPAGNLIPQTFHLADNQGDVFGEYRTHFNPFVHKMTVRVFSDCPLSPFVVLASGVLLLAIEGRQKD